MRLYVQVPELHKTSSGISVRISWPSDQQNALVQQSHLQIRQSTRLHPVACRVPSVRQTPPTLTLTMHLYDVLCCAGGGFGSGISGFGSGLGAMGMMGMGSGGSGSFFSSSSFGGGLGGGGSGRTVTQTTSIINGREVTQKVCPVVLIKWQPTALPFATWPPWASEFMHCCISVHRGGGGGLGANLPPFAPPPRPRSQ